MRLMPKLVPETAVIERTTQAALMLRSTRCSAFDKLCLNVRHTVYRELNAMKCKMVREHGLSLGSNDPAKSARASSPALNLESTASRIKHTHFSHTLTGTMATKLEKTIQRQQQKYVSRV